MKDVFYIPASSIAVAEYTGNAVWQLQHPGSDKKAFGYLVSADETVIMLQIPNDLVVTIHQDANEHIFAHILEGFRDMGLISQGDVDRVCHVIDSRRGRRVPILTFFPAFWTDMMKTYDELVESGFFGEDEE